MGPFFALSPPYNVWFLRYVAWQNFLSFWVIFCPNPKNQNFEKMKKHLETSSFYICIPKIIIAWCSSWDMVCNRWTDGWTDGQKKWHIERGAPPKNWLRLNLATNLQLLIIKLQANQLLIFIHFFICRSLNSYSFNYWSFNCFFLNYHSFNYFSPSSQFNIWLAIYTNQR